jgi:hypothetical protein
MAFSVRPIRISHGQFRLVVESLDRTRRDFSFGFKPIWQKRLVPS